MSRPATSKSEAPDRMSGAYRAVWRWHFYAGVLVMPFLMLLALTGGLYLFKDEIDQVANRRMIQIPHAATETAPEAWIASAAQAGGGRAASLLLPAAADQAVRVRVDRPDGAQKTVFVDPHTARVTGVTDYGGVTEIIKKLHSLSLFGGTTGKALNILIEIVAGWTIVLCATGLYLWWPRRRQGAVLVPRETDARRRPFWRDLHALVGLYVGGVILFLAVTGMPWSAVWGDQVMGLVKASGWGRPPAPVAGAWQRAEHDDHPAGAGWTMEGVVLPAPSHDRHDLTAVVTTAEVRDLPRPYTVSIPVQADTAYTVTAQVRRVQDSRTLYIDPARGAVLADIGFDRFGPGAKAIEWGIYTHQGTQFGQINRLIMLAGCIGVWLLGLSGLMMWWKRRPPSLARARLGAPTAPPGPRIRLAILGIVIPLCILYPLTGLSLVAVLLLDFAARRLMRPRPVVS
ncbi:PepSY-associated TM helix domain-containing protein [Brevundimonas sp. NPDC058933]|uniref:PepSY-associated TM helix domain-containing protein n=1 Tax=Brevundimonas sp. NPDC058933 TaxID=3346673 RepID=UPI003BEF4B88